MSSFPFKPEFHNLPIQTQRMIELARATLYRIKCEEIIVKWFMLLDYHDLDEWFDSNRCCLPITLSRMLDKRIITEETTI